MKKQNSSGKVPETNSKLTLDNTKITVCPWCFCVTDYYQEAKIKCKVCKSLITPEDIVNYWIKKEEE